jgi:hypothetical protein
MGFVAMDSSQSTSTSSMRGIGEVDSNADKTYARMPTAEEKATAEAEYIDYCSSAHLQAEEYGAAKRKAFGDLTNSPRKAMRVSYDLTEVVEDTKMAAGTSSTDDFFFLEDEESSRKTTEAQESTTTTATATTAASSSTSLKENFGNASSIANASSYAAASRRVSGPALKPSNDSSRVSCSTKRTVSSNLARGKVIKRAELFAQVDCEYLEADIFSTTIRDINNSVASHFGLKKVPNDMRVAIRGRLSDCVNDRVQPERVLHCNDRKMNRRASDDLLSNGLLGEVASSSIHSSTVASNSRRVSNVNDSLVRDMQESMMDAVEVGESLGDAVADAARSTMRSKLATTNLHSGQNMAASRSTSLIDGNLSSSPRSRHISEWKSKALDDLTNTKRSNNATRGRASKGAIVESSSSRKVSTLQRTTQAKRPGSLMVDSRSTDSTPFAAAGSSLKHITSKKGDSKDNGADRKTKRRRVTMTPDDDDDEYIDYEEAEEYFDYDYGVDDLDSASENSSSKSSTNTTTNNSWMTTNVVGQEFGTWQKTMKAASDKARKKVKSK